MIFIVSIFPYTFLSQALATGPEVYLKDSKPYGIPYNEWILKWWSWNVDLPMKGNPLITSHLENCPVGQDGQVSFLTGALQGEARYTCTIPSGHAILIPISPGECNSNERHSESEGLLLKCATEGNAHAKFKVSVDGVPINGLEHNHAVSRFFNMTIPGDNVFNFKAGKFKAVTSGYFLFLKPLQSGQHAVDIVASNIDPIDQSLNFNYHTLFLLKVK